MVFESKTKKWDPGARCVTIPSDTVKKKKTMYTNNYRASQTSPLAPDKCNISLMTSEISRTGGAEMGAGGQAIDVLSMKADEM